MNEIWSISTIVSSSEHMVPFPWLVAQASPSSTTLDLGSASTNVVNSLTTSLGPMLISLVGAVGILLLGWIIASVVSGVCRRLLKQTSLDNRLATWVTGSSQVGANVETLAATIVFWIIMILALVAALNVLNLTTVSQPLNYFLNQIFSFLPRLGSAALLTAVAWLVASLVRGIVFRASHSLKLDERVQLLDGEPGAQGQPLISRTLGNALYWFIFLFFLPLILGVLGLQGSLLPVQNLLDELLAALPKILKALLIGGIGWLVARIVRDIVTNLLAATGLDQFGAKLGLSRSAGSQPLSWLSGNVVFVLILIPTITAALDALQIPAVSEPATAMLNQVLSTLPQIITAVFILTVAFFIGQFLSELMTHLLTGIGFNNLFQWLGLSTAPSQTLDSLFEDLALDLGETLDTGATPSEPIEAVTIPQKTPSEVAGMVVLIGTMLFATVAATNVLNIPALTQISSGLLLIGGQILAGVTIFAIGLYLANLAFNLISSSGSHQTRILAQSARIAIIALVAAMALQQMGIATSIVNLAFGLLLGAIAVAIAIAFGLGGRDIAAEQIRGWLNGFSQK